MSIGSPPPLEGSKNEPSLPAPAAGLGRGLLHGGLRLARRVIVAVLGGTVLIFGLVLIFTPGPAILVVPAGLGILAAEFAWARKLLARLRARARILASEPSSLDEPPEPNQATDLQPTQAKDLRIRVYDDASSASLEVAREIVALVRERETTVLGLATGRTPLLVYAELARVHAEGQSFGSVVSFNLDEFAGVSASDPRSFRSTMQRELFDALDVAANRIHVPCGEGDADQQEAACRAYEAAITAAGGIDLQLLGMAANGHVGFNEPGSPADSRCRRVRLAEATRRAYGPSFEGGLAPSHGVTVGIATIREARRLRLLAFGAEKAEAVKRLVNGEPDPDFPASLLRGHPDFELILDRAAASSL